MARPFSSFFFIFHRRRPRNASFEEILPEPGINGTPGQSGP
jgi:hypothetical protein